MVVEMDEGRAYMPLEIRDTNGMVSFLQKLE